MRRGLRLRRRGSAPILAAIEPDRNGKAAVPVGGIGRRDFRRGDHVEVFGVRRGETVQL